MQMFPDMMLKFRLACMVVITGLFFKIFFCETGLLNLFLPSWLGLIMAFGLTNIVDVGLSNIAYISGNDKWFIRRRDEVNWATPGWYFGRVRTLFRFPTDEFEYEFPACYLPAHCHSGWRWKMKVRLDRTSLDAVRAFVAWTDSLWSVFSDGKISDHDARLNVSVMIDRAMREEKRFSVSERKAI